MNKLLVAVIAYNEEKNIQNTIKDLERNNFGYDIIVIDNGSIDKTKEICEKLEVNVISHCINSDINGTWKTYFLYAYMNNYDIVCQFDGDGQHIASELPKIINSALRGEADLIIGSRFIEKKGFQSFFLRRMGIIFFSRILSLILGYKIKDVTTGFLAFNWKVISFFAKYYKQDHNQTHLLTHLSGAKMKEVPVLMSGRKHGKSLFNFVNSIAFPFNGIVNIIGCLLLKNQIKREWVNKNEF